MENSLRKYRSYHEWIIEVGEERLLEQKLLKEDFDSREEFMLFLVVTLRFHKKLFAEVRDSLANKSHNKGIKDAFSKPNMTSEDLDKFINGYLKKEKKIKHYGTTRLTISQQTNIPRTTVKRIIDRLIERKILTVTNKDNLIVPTALARKKLLDYRRYLFVSNKRLNKIFNDADLVDFEDVETKDYW